MTRLSLISVVVSLGLIAPAFAAGPTKPVGNPTLNQVIYGLPLTKDDTATFPPTRGLHIGDGTACNLSVVFASNPGVVVAIGSVQPGLSYPYSIVQLKAATTCSSVVGLW